MKHFYTLVLALFITGLGYGQITENFDTGLANSYFTGNRTLNSGSWSMQAVIQESSGNSRSGFAARINDDINGAHLTTPSLNGAGTLSFWYRELNSGGGTFEIQKSTDGTNYTTVSSQSFSGTTFTQFTYNIDDSSSNLTIRILNDDQSGHLIIDDLDITAPAPSGPDNPDAFSSAIISSSQIDLIYDDNAATDNIVIVFDTDNTFTTPTGAPATVGNAFAGGTILFNNNGASTFNHTSLIEGTTYYYMAYSYDGTDYSTGLSTNATTPCAAITSFPFTEGFETGVPPSCWTSFRGTNGLGTVEDWKIDTDANTGTNAAFVRWENIGSTTEDWLVTPPLDLSSTPDAELSFFTKDANATDFLSSYSIRVSTTSQTDHASFSTIQTYTETELGNSYNEKIVDLSAYSGTIYIAFVLTQDDGDSWFIDDVEVKQGTSKNATIVESGFDETDNIDYLAYDSASGLLDSNALKIGEFIIRDAGGAPSDTDALTTTLTDITFDITGFDNIIALAIFDGPANVSEQIAVTASTAFTGLSLSAPDDGTYTFSVYATFKSTVIDNEQIQLTISSATADGIGSTFAAADAGGATTSITGDDNRIEVTATDLIFDTNVSSSVLNVAMSPSPSVIAVDSNANTDLDFGDSITLSPSTAGIFDAAAVTSVTAVSGEAIFNALIFDTVGSGYTLTAESGLLNTDTSNAFNITALPPTCNSIFSDDFSSDLSQWSNTADWTINNGELRHDLSNTESESYTYTDLGSQDLTSGDYEWNYCMRNGSWDPSTGNKFGFVLLSDSFNFLFQPTGYAVGINQTGSSDLLKLYSINNGVYTEILASVYNWNSLDDVCVRVTRDSTGSWELFYSADGAAEVSAGSVTDTSYTSGSYAGPIFDFTSSRAGELWVDDVNLCKTDGTVNFIFDGTSWSPADPNGISTSLDKIIVESGDAIISSNTDADTVTVNPGASLTVDATATLTIADATDGLTLESTSSSYASLIRNGSISGTINYERYVNQVGSGSTIGNDLVSVPLTQFLLNFQSFLEFGNPSNRDVLVTNGANTVHAFGPYDNENQQFVNYPTYLPTAPPDPAAPQLISGKGYRAASTSGANITFTGSALASDVSIAITTPNVLSSQWNLIGNPYPSYVDAAKFLAANSGPMEDAAEAIYAYNSGTTYSINAATTGNYTIINAATISAFPGENFNIAPGQGFFVPADITPANFSGTVTFTTGPTAADDMRTTAGSDDYIAGRNSDLTYVLKLGLTSNTEITTSFFFNENASRGLDAGYDAKAFGNTSIYSHLVEDNTGLAMALQSLSINDLSDVSIPLGVNANQGQQVTFSIALSTLPNTISVYLDDTVNNTSTLLNNSDYVLTPSVNLNGTGRFYLRIGDSALSSTKNTFDNLNIYTSKADKTIVISGQLAESTVAYLFDLQGRKVITTDLITSSSSQTIDVSDLSTGVYVIQLQNASQTKTQKVILK